MPTNDQISPFFHSSVQNQPYQLHSDNTLVDLVASDYLELYKSQRA